MKSFEIQLKKVSLFYQKQCLFRDLELNLPAASCTCLLGPSGIGKSSLLQLMAGMSLGTDSYITGKILVNNESSIAGHVMLMTQQDALFSWLDVLDNVLIGYKLRNNLTSFIKQRAVELLLSMGLQESDFYKKPKQLSGGMKQKVALIRTVIEDKPIWLLDEPFSAVDAVTRYQLQNDLTHLWQGKTVLLATHDPLEALRLADYIYVLSGKPARLKAIQVPKTPMPRTIDQALIQCQQEIFACLQEE